MGRGVQNHRIHKTVEWAGVSRECGKARGCPESARRGPKCAEPVSKMVIKLKTVVRKRPPGTRKWVSRMWLSPIGLIVPIRPIGPIKVLRKAGVQNVGRPCPKCPSRPTCLTCPTSPCLPQMREARGVSRMRRGGVQNQVKGCPECSGFYSDY